jgi:hypothetical protein
MTPDLYRTALATLGLSQQAAGRWLGVSRKTAQNFATVGPSAPAWRAMTMLLAMSPDDRERELGRTIYAAPANNPLQSPPALVS